jgi:hypothetical protein
VTVHEACPERRRTRIGETIGGCPPFASIRSGNETPGLPHPNLSFDMRLITTVGFSSVAELAQCVSYAASGVRVHSDAFRQLGPIPGRPIRPTASCKLSSNQSFRFH